MMLPPKNSSPAPTPQPAQPAAPAESALDQPDTGEGGEGAEWSICKVPEGTFTVKKRPYETPEEEAGEGEPSKDQVLAEGLSSMEEAMKVVAKDYKATAPGGSPQEKFMGGFAGQNTQQPQV